MTLASASGIATDTYLLRAFGFSPTQRVVIQSLCKLSVYRSRAYELLSPAEEDSRPASICLVNLSDDDALDRWRGIAGDSGDPPAVLVADDAPEISGPGVYHCSPKRLSSSLLAFLDDIVVQHFGPSSCRDIGTDMSVPAHVIAPSAHDGYVARALVVDDSEAVCAQMRLLLQRQSVEVEVCRDATSALDALKSRNYDVVFLDVVLPDMEGYKACRQIKSNPRTQDLPVIMLTGKGSRFNKVQGRMAGCERYLIKPASEQQVMEALRTCIDLPG